MEGRFGAGIVSRVVQQAGVRILWAVSNTTNSVNTEDRFCSRSRGITSVTASWNQCTSFCSEFIGRFGPCGCWFEGKTSKAVPPWQLDLRRSSRSSMSIRRRFRFGARRGELKGIVGTRPLFQRDQPLVDEFKTRAKKLVTRFLRRRRESILSAEDHFASAEFHPKE